jgi:hypothetical protein
MKFEFAKYTDVTKLAFELNPEYEKNSYVKVFLCEDTKVFWISRVLKGFNDEYEEDPDSYLVERERVDKTTRAEKLRMPRAKQILTDDNLENWDCYQYDSLEDAIKSIDDGYGLN